MVADGPPCQGNCTGRGHLEAVASGNAADRAAEKLWGEGATAELLVGRAAEGDEAALEALAGIGHLLGAGIGSFVNIFGAGARDRRRRLRHRRGRVPVPRGARGRPAGGVLEPARAGLRIVKAELGSDAGLIGAGLVAFEALDGRLTCPLAVCATPIGNLEDVTLRVLRELAEADVVLCEDTRHTQGLLDAARDRGAGCSATTSTTRRSATASSCRGSRRASGSRSSRTRACRA